MPKPRSIILIAVFIFLFAATLIGFLVYQRQKLSSALLSPLAQLPPEFAEVLSESTSSAQTASSPSPTLTPFDTRSEVTGNFTIAILGDSMVDTLGDLSLIKNQLNQTYPNVNFKLLNYGIGSTNAASGLKRLTESSVRQNQTLPPLLTQNPDLILIESFAYNHAANTPEDLNNHENTLNQSIQTIRNSLPSDILLLTTISPNLEFYAIGAPGINWSNQQRKSEAETVLAYLKITSELAKKSNIPQVDAATSSQDSSGNGKRIFIESTTNIHPSPEGIELISGLISQKIVDLGIIDNKLPKDTTVLDF